MKVFMKAVYVEEVEKTLKYFVFGLKKDENDSDEYHFEGIKEIAERAFCSPWNIKRVFFDELAKLNITEDFVYPDMDNVAHEISEQFSKM